MKPSPDQKGRELEVLILRTARQSQEAVAGVVHMSKRMVRGIEEWFRSLSEEEVQHFCDQSDVETIVGWMLDDSTPPRYEWNNITPELRLRVRNITAEDILRCYGRTISAAPELAGHPSKMKLPEPGQERHNDNLIRLCEALKDAVCLPFDLFLYPKSDPLRDLSREELFQSLRQHQPGSVPGQDLEEWQNTLTQYWHFRTGLRKKIPRVEAQGAWVIGRFRSNDPRDYIEHRLLVEAHKVERKSEESQVGLPGLKIPILSAMGAPSVGVMSMKEGEDPGLLDGVCQEALQWQEFSDVREAYAALFEIQRRVHSIIDRWIASGWVLGTPLCFLCGA